MKKRFKKLVSTLLAVTLIAGTAVMTPIADVVGTRIVAEATSESSSYIYHNCIGKYLDAGTQIFPNGRVYRMTVYLDNTLVLYQSAGTYTLPNRVYVNDNTTQNDNVYVLYFTTAKLNQSPTISVESKTYDGSAVSYDAGTGYGTCTVNFTGINGTSYDSTTAPSTAGDYRMTVSYEGDGNYNSWSGTADFTISRATPNYTVPSNLTALCGQTLADVTLPTGWEWVNPSTSLSSVGENTFKATYTPTDTTNYNVVDNVDVTVNVSIPAYTVTWKNEDGTVLETDENVEENATPEYNGETPTKENTAQYTYTFKGWTSDNGTTVYTAETLPAVTDNVTYTAVFESTVNTYTVTWVDGDGNTTTDTVAYGEIPVYSGETPTKTATAQYTYTFSGWDNEPTAVTGDVTYTATFTSTVNQYTVTFNSNGGSTVDAQTVAYGSTASVPAEPTKEGYNFTGWYNGETAFDFTTAITENITLTAGWEDTKNYIDKGKHLWYTFDETNGALVIYGDGNAATMARFFYDGGGKALNKKIKTVTFDASANVSGANSSFRGCSNLTTVEGNLPSGTIQTMFYGCTNLESVPAIPTNASNTSNMFKGCTKLTSIGDDNNITLRANMINGMFEGCKALSANVIIDNRFSTVSEELGTNNIKDIFTGAATEDGTKIIVCFGSLIKHNNQYAMENIKAQMGGNVQLHDMSNYVDDGNGTTHSHICSQCGEKETENHTFDNGVCTVCGALEDYTITVTNGIIAKGEKEIYHVGDIVNLQADTPEEGKVFAYWQDANGNKLSTKANYSFVVLQSIDLTAVYNDNYVAEEILNISAVQTSSNGKNAIRFVFNRSVDTKAEVEEVGLIYATNKLAGYTSGAKVNLTELEGFDIEDIETVLKENTSGTVKTYKSTSTSINGTIRFTYTIGNNTDCYVYAYGYVKLSDGTTLYTDLIATTYNSIG